MTEDQDMRELIIKTAAGMEHTTTQLTTILRVQDQFQKALVAINTTMNDTNQRVREVGHASEMREERSKSRDQKLEQDFNALHEDNLEHKGNDDRRFEELSKAIDKMGLPARTWMWLIGLAVASALTIVGLILEFND